MRGGGGGGGGGGGRGGGRGVKSITRIKTLKPFMTFLFRIPKQGVIGLCDGAGKTSCAGASYSRARAYCAYSRCGWELF